ncbi:MAG: response regulator transcription factor [Bacteroidales bacterium]|nr:response regulator transcription factor [Bacteroidales bacterium]
MIRTVIIEDSEGSIDLLSGLLKDYTPEIELVGIAKNIEFGISMIKEKAPDLVFLDIELKDKTGFDLLKEFPNKNFEVIFVTGFNNYAIEAFKHNALHYIVKPVNPTDLKEAVKRVENRRNERKVQETTNYASYKSIDRKIDISTEHETRFVPLKDILYIKADGSYSQVVLVSNKKILLSKLLKEFEKKLSKEEDFFRVSKSYIVNLNHVALIKHIDGGLIEMSDGVNITISRRKKSEFTIRIMKFMNLA